MQFNASIWKQGARFWLRQTFSVIDISSKVPVQNEISKFNHLLVNYWLLSHIHLLPCDSGAELLDTRWSHLTELLAEGRLVLQDLSCQSNWRIERDGEREREEKLAALSKKCVWVTERGWSLKNEWAWGNQEGLCLPVCVCVCLARHFLPLHMPTHETDGSHLYQPWSGSVLIGNLLMVCKTLCVCVS